MAFTIAKLCSGFGLEEARLEVMQKADAAPTPDRNRSGRTHWNWLTKQVAMFAATMARHGEQREA